MNRVNPSLCNLPPSHSTIRKYRPRQHGFTLIELLVAIGVTLILLVIIGRLFGDIGKTTELFAANSQVTDYVAGLGNSLRDDFRRLSKEGFMVIRTRSVYVDPTGADTTGASEIKLTPANYPAYNAMPPTNPEPERVNTDLLMLFADGPWTTQRYDNATYASGTASLNRSLQAPVAKVTYGHLAGNWNTSLSSSQAFQSEYDQTGNRIDNTKWTLGRHSLLLVNSSPPVYATPMSDFTLAPTNIFMMSSTYDAAMSTADFTAYPTIPAIIPVPVPANAADVVNKQQSIRYGLWDVAYNSDLPDIRSAILNTTGTTAPSNARRASWVANALDIPVRCDDACFRVFGRRNYYGQYGTPRTQNMLTTSVLAPYCSNFQVEFAGSYVTPSNTTGVDREDPTANGNPVTYSSANSAYPIYWYGGIQLSKSATLAAGRRRIANTALKVNVFEFNGPTADSTNAAYTTGQAEDLSTSTDSGRRQYTAVFGYDRSSTGSPWPMLIRVTATFHDDKGRFRQAFLRERNAGTGASILQDGRTYQWVIEVPQ